LVILLIAIKPTLDKDINWLKEFDLD